MIHFSDFLKDKTILVTGGSGSFGQAFVKKLLTFPSIKKVIVFSRDEWKQSDMREKDPIFNSDKIRYFLGDIRDKERLKLAFREVDYIVHAAALKQVPAAEYNPTEFIKTNILGSMNVMQIAIEMGVKKVISLSTDKAVAPINLYGATKLCADKLILNAKAYVGNRNNPKFSVVRYGNVLGSKGSLIPKWQKLIEKKTDHLPITSTEMTRFWISMDRAVEFVFESLQKAVGGEIFVPKIPSMTLVALAKALAPNMPIKECGIRPGEKLHEQLITTDEARFTVEFDKYFVIYPNWSQRLPHKTVSPDFEYSSNNSKEWLDIEAIQELLDKSLSF